MIALMPAERHHRGHGGKQAVHRQGLQRQGVGGDPVEEVTHAGPAVKAERQTVQMRVEIAPQRGHHPLADADRGVVAQHGERTDRGVNHDEGGARREEERRLRPPGGPSERRGRVTQHRVDDDLEGQGFKS